jgi:hypothetical protein
VGAEEQRGAHSDRESRERDGGVDQQGAGL